MSFSKSWLTEPPEVPNYGEMPSGAVRQFASAVRALVLEDTATPALKDWLYSYEERFTPPAQRTLQKPEEPHPPAAAAAPLPQNISENVAGVLKEIGHAVREIRTGFAEILGKVDLAYASSLEKLNEGVDKLNQGMEKVLGAYDQIGSDYRSLLAISFEHIGDMQRTTNESMAAYRNGLLAEARANSIVKGAEAASTLDQEGGKLIMGLLGEAVKKKMGLGEEQAAAGAPAPPPAAPAPEVKK